MSVLIVDDSVIIRVILERNLIGLGVPEHEIYQAENGEKGLARFVSFRCDGIVTDLRMPVMDGLTFVREVRKLNATVPIVAVTSANDRENVVAAIESGVNDYLIKPFAAGDVRKKLQRLLEWSQNQTACRPNPQLPLVTTAP
jgi:two-component system, chemotaxis family, chemotaxis protein CheY